MLFNEKSNLILMVQGARRVFCYFNASPMTAKEFEDSYGESSWKNSKPIIKVYSVEGCIAKEIKTIFIDAFSDNWYIDIDRDDVDVFVKIGRLFPDNTFTELAVSNTVTTPRDHEAGDTFVYFVDISKDPVLNSEMPLLKYEDNILNHNKAKPYTYGNKKDIHCYPEIIIEHTHYHNDFIDEYFDEMINKYSLNSSQIK